MLTDQRKTFLEEIMCAGSVDMKYKYNLVVNHIYPMIGCMIVENPIREPLVNGNTTIATSKYGD